MPRLSAVALAVLSSLAVATVASSAAAEAAAAAGPQFQGCQVSLLPNGTSLPSNAPALIITDNSSKAKATISAELVNTATDARTRFVGPSMDAHGLNVVTFGSPAPSLGAHRISKTVSCAVDGQEPRSQTDETSITLTAPVAFPKTVGTLSVRAAASPSNGVDWIVLDASPELRAFFPVSKLRLVIDTGAASKPQGGAYVPSGNTRPEFHAQTGAVCVENGALHREKRTVKVSVAADIAGVADSPAPATLDIEVDCGAIRWTSISDPTNPGNPNNPNNPNNPTGPSGVTTNGGSDGGCSAAPGGVGSGGAAALVAGALAVLAGLRRRRRAA